MINAQKRDIEKRTFEFGVAVIRFCKILEQKTGTDRILARQLARSATSIGANVEEAQGAISKADFIHKNFIALKEARETLYWLRLLLASGTEKAETIGDLVRESEELTRILGAIVLRARQNETR